MAYQVRITRKALAEVNQGFVWLKKRSRPAAERWRAALLEAVDSLAANPESFALAPETEWYPGELRQLLHGKKRSMYRILFEVQGEVVYVLRVRHSAQDLLKPGDL
jgi:plasmid stabilization system protein ParE